MNIWLGTGVIQRIRVRPNDGVVWLAVGCPAASISGPNAKGRVIACVGNKGIYALFDPENYPSSGLPFKEGSIVHLACEVMRVADSQLSNEAGIFYLDTVLVIRGIRDAREQPFGLLTLADGGVDTSSMGDVDYGQEYIWWQRTKTRRLDKRELTPLDKNWPETPEETERWRRIQHVKRDPGFIAWRKRRKMVGATGSGKTPASKWSRKRK